MQFKQNTEDGSCDIIFNEKEVEIISKNKKLHFTPEAFKHFGNALARVIFEWNLHFNDDVKNMQSYDDTVIEGNDEFNK